MKASEEISADLFIKNCLSQGMDYRREIVNLAEEEKSTGFASNVDELIRSGESKAYSGKLNQRQCDTHNVDMMFDENNREHYCPLCQ